MWLAAFTMPRFDGVSATTTLWPIRRNPKPRAELRMLANWPAILLIKVTLMVFSVMTSTYDFRDGLAALRRNIVRGAQLAQRIHSGAHHIDRIARAVALREHVAHAGEFEHRAHAAAGDHARAVRGGLHVYPGGSMPAFDRVEQRIVLQRYVDQALARLHHRLGYCHRHFARLAVTKPDAPGAVADDREGREAELLSALDHLRHTIHRDQLLEQIVAGHWFFYSRHSALRSKG